MGVMDAGIRRERRLARTVNIGLVSVVLAGSLIAVWVTFFAGPPVIHAGNGPAALAVAPDGSILYVADSDRDGLRRRDDHTVMPVNVATGRPGPPIRVSGEPQAIVITPDGRTMYVASYDGTITPVSTATGKAGKPIRPGAGPYGPNGIAVTPDGRTLYIAGNDLMLISTATGKAGKPIRIPGGPSDLLMAPDGRTLYVLAGNNLNLVIPVDVGTGRPGEPIRLAGITYALAIAPNGKTLYAAGDMTRDSVVTPVSTATGRPAAPIVIPDSPGALAVSPDGRTLYVAIPDDGTVIPVDLAARSLGPPIRIASRWDQGYPVDLVITPNDRDLYVIDASSNDIAQIILPVTADHAW
jgi:hyaluronoglucosaminidase